MYLQSPQIGKSVSERGPLPCSSNGNGEIAPEESGRSVYGY